jgi:hypothetical protein
MPWYSCNIAKHQSINQPIVLQNTGNVERNSFRRKGQLIYAIIVLPYHTMHVQYHCKMHIDKSQSMNRTLPTMQWSPHDKFFSFYLDKFIKINSRIWFGPVNSNDHFESCNCIANCSFPC